jgi:hypothetical protein
LVRAALDDLLRVGIANARVRLELLGSGSGVFAIATEIFTKNAG